MLHDDDAPLLLLTPHLQYLRSCDTRYQRLPGIYHGTRGSPHPLDQKKSRGIAASFEELTDYMKGIVVILLATGNLIWLAHCFRPLRCTLIKSSRTVAVTALNNNDIDSESSKASGSESLESLFQKIDEMGLKDVPQDVEDEINQKLNDGAPPDWKVRLGIMGFTPLTIAGYVLAFLLIALNTIFGYGWASRLIGMDGEVATPSNNYLGPTTMDTRSDLSKSLPSSDAGVIRYDISTIKLNKPENLLEAE